MRQKKYLRNKRKEEEENVQCDKRKCLLAYLLVNRTAPLSERCQRGVEKLHKCQTPLRCHSICQHSLMYLHSMAFLLYFHLVLVMCFTERIFTFLLVVEDGDFYKLKFVFVLNLII